MDTKEKLKYIDGLTSEERDVFYYRFFFNLNVNEIAQHLHKSNKTVRKIVRWLELERWYINYKANKLEEFERDQFLS